MSGQPVIDRPVSDLPTPIWLRGPVFVASATALAVVAHVAAGEQTPDGVRLVVAVLAGGALFSSVARREQSVRCIVALVVAAQMLLHLVLAAAPPPPDGIAVHAHVGSGSGSGLLMDAAHLVAAAVLALWLSRGERCAWRAVARALVQLLVDRRPPTTVVPVRTRIAVDLPRPRPCPALPVTGLRAPPLPA